VRALEPSDEPHAAGLVLPVRNPDGGQVSTNPALRRAEICPACKRLILLNADGRLRAHVPQKGVPVYERATLLVRDRQPVP